MLDSKEFRALTPEARHLLQTIKARRINNMTGLFFCETGELYTLSEQTGYDMDTIRDAIENLSEWDWVSHRDGIMWVRNQLKFDPSISLDNENHVSAIKKILEEIPECELKSNFLSYYNLKISGDGIPDPIPDPTTDGMGDGIPDPGTGTGTGIRNRKQETGTGTGNRKSLPGKPGACARKIPDTDHGKLIEYWMQLHMNRFNEKYDFKGQKDGPTIKRVLKSYGLEKSMALMETFLNLDDEFVRKAGYTLGVFSSQINKLIQKPILADDALSKFSERARNNIRASREWLMKSSKETKNA